MNISICIPTYNQSSYLEIAILSAFNQSLKPFEIIVSDDFSTDDTSILLEKLKIEIPILKVIKQEKNLGIAQNTDFCLRQAVGEFIVRLDSDDCLLPDYLLKLSNELIKYPTAAYAHAAVQEIDQYGHKTRLRILARNSGYISDSQILKQSKSGYKVAANIIMFRKSCLEQVDFNSNRPDYVEDYHLSVSLAIAGFGNVYLSEVLSCYRIWIDVGKVRQKRKLMEIKGLTKVFNELLLPAYQVRNWSTFQLEVNINKIARNQSDCLAWNVYTEEERKELHNNLKYLSNTLLSNIWYFMCLNKMNKFIIAPRFTKTIKCKLKEIYYSSKS